MLFSTAARRDPKVAVRALAPLLAAASLMAPPLAVFVPLAIAPLVGALAILVAAVGRPAALRASREPRAVAILLLLLALWAAFSALWSPIPGHSLVEAGRFLLISIAGLVILGACCSLDEQGAARLGVAVLGGTILAIALLQLELRAGEPLGHLLKHLPRDQFLPMERYDRGVTVLMLMAWPAAAGLLRQKRVLIAVIMAALTLATLLEFVSQAAALAALVGLAVLPGGWFAPRLVAAGLIAPVLAMGLVFPPLAPDGHAIAAIHRAVPEIKISGIHRLAIWRFAAEHIAEHPVLGWGMDAARALPGGKTPVSVVMPEVELPPTSEILPLHPHDAALQWRLELGLPGFLLAAALVAWLLLRVAGTPIAWYRALGFGYTAAVLTVALLSYGAWQEWWLAALWLSAAGLAGLRPRAAMPSP